MTYLVPAIALSSALLTAAATILIRRGYQRYGPYTAMWINVAVGMVCVWAAVLFTGGLGGPSPAGIAYFALAGLIGTVAGRLLRFMSIETVGASITAALSNLSPLVSTVLAILFLGEHVTAPILVGTVVIVFGTTLLSSSGRGFAVSPRKLVLPLLSAVCFGVVAVLRKAGLSGMAPIPGFAVNVTAAFVAFTAFLVASRQMGAMACRGWSLVYFVAAGVAENVGVFMIVLALSYGTVSVVAPLASVAPIFVLVLSFFFLRGLEILTARIVIGTLLIVAGVWLLTALAGR
ncbi:MAG TPA: DMT family transporter [Candidatus Limnocylindria bacterium]|nr:DMT family transporter [Candidatus Limnocylindria bacterium]